MTPPTDKLEAETRKEIDTKLQAAGWAVQDTSKLDLYGQVGADVREVFDEGNAFCKKITYKVGKKTEEESIKAFRTEPQYRIPRGVTEAQRRKSLLKPEGVLKGKSQSYYEQMKGRGTRIISRDELHKGFEISRCAA